MSLDHQKLLALDLAPIEHTYGPKDCILYALGVGVGQDPLDARQLAFVYEKNLQVLPTFAVVLGYSPYSFRRPELGITWSHVVHGEHGLIVHEPIPARRHGVRAGRAFSTSSTKARASGALIYSERKIAEKTSGDLLATITQTTFCRGDGGFGGPKRETPPPHAMPERAPDCDLRSADAAGDRPALSAVRRRQPAARRSGVRQDGRLSEADPARPRDLRRRRPRFAETGLRLRSGAADGARRCGFQRRSIRARPSAPKFGATERSSASAARVLERDVIAINNGRAEIA